ncbi:enoyl-CoA hydratase/isomerase family protein [Pyruvatibacter mobilis]|uniref:enoyl-CoA hydratase/isomerase family protein n=1 Tax=Pyruvatibacter mobilis TaxID=1712261 RepID=UPI003BAB28BE
MIQLDRQDSVFTLTMDAGENRWNTAFVREFGKALDEVEASTGPAALVTRSTDAKFFSNGLDLDWVQDPDAHPEGGDRDVFGGEFMALMGRIITLPVPTICAINGHAFGAGFMSALCHDIRIMREDRGFICANEMQIGLKIPSPELALFRHKLPANAFFETVQFARRWTGPDAQAAGVVQHVAALETLPELAHQLAQQMAPLGANRELFGDQKERLFGENAILNSPHGAAHLLKHSADYS